MHHLPVFPDQVRLAIGTFAADAEVVVDGISSEPFTKCDFFQEGGYWEKVIYKAEYVYSNDTYKLNDSVAEDTSMKNTLMKASSILDAGIFTKIYFDNGICPVNLVAVSDSLTNKVASHSHNAIRMYEEA